jgi:hypothetical protein
MKRIRRFIEDFERFISKDPILKELIELHNQIPEIIDQIKINDLSDPAIRRARNLLKKLYDDIFQLENRPVWKEYKAYIELQLKQFQQYLKSISSYNDPSGYVNLAYGYLHRILTRFIEAENAKR